MQIVARTHGGLGNQLFQIFYARLLAKQSETPDLIVVHDLRYKHRFDLSTQFAVLRGPPPPLVHWLSSIRLPKLVSKVRLTYVESMRLGGTIYLDGYFQRPDQYNAFSDRQLFEELRRLRAEFNIDGDFDSVTLIHLRLGDFFGNEADQINHLEVRLRRLPRDAHIITNRDDLLLIPDYAAALKTFGCQHIPTSTLSADALLRLMSRYKSIESNNSTLAFWASVLTGSEVAFSLVPLTSLRTRLLGAANHWRSCGRR